MLGAACDMGEPLRPLRNGLCWAQKGDLSLLSAMFWWLSSYVAFLFQSPPSSLTLPEL